MSRNYGVWILGLLLVIFTGNFGPVSHHQFHHAQGQGESIFEWGNALQNQRYLPHISEGLQQGFVYHRLKDGKNFVNRRLLATTNNGTKNGSSPPPARLSRAQKISFTVGYAFILSVGLSGNLLILVVVAKNKEFHNNLNSLLCNLVVADLLRMLVGIPFELFMVNKIGDAVSPVPSVPGAAGDLRCKIFFAAPPIFSCAFVFTLVFMTCERFVAIVFPFKAVVLKNKSKWIILGVWLSAIALEIPGLYAFNSVRMSNGDYICSIDFSPFCDDKQCAMKAYKRFLSAVVYISYVIAFVFILSLHAVMVIVLYRNRAKFDAGSTRTSRTAASSTRDVVRMLGVVSLVYLLTTLPNQVYHFGSLYQNAWLTRSMPVYFNFLLLFIANSYSMFNPWIYPIFVRRFRTKYAALLRKYLRSKKDRTQSDSSTKSGRPTTMTRATLQDSLTNRLIGNNSNETKL